MASSDTRNLTALKGIALAATFSLASGQLSTSALFIPAMLRPLDGSREKYPTSPSLSRQSTSALNIPSASTDGRLTPQPSGTFDFTQSVKGPYKGVARQFAQLEALTYRASVPIEVIALGMFSVAAVRSRNAGSKLWTHWAVAAGLVGTVFPLSAVWMAPLVLKIKRLGGDEEKIEPYEDAPIDRDAEKSNTVEFLTTWSYMNFGRSMLLYAAAGIGVLALLDE